MLSHQGWGHLWGPLGRPPCAEDPLEPAPGLDVILAFLRLAFPVVRIGETLAFLAGGWESTTMSSSAVSTSSARRRTDTRLGDSREDDDAGGDTVIVPSPAEGMSLGVEERVLSCRSKCGVSTPRSLVGLAGSDDDAANSITILDLQGRREAFFGGAAGRVPAVGLGTIVAAASTCSSTFNVPLAFT